MDANSRRSWAPLETVELPTIPSFRSTSRKKVVSVDAFLDVLVMIRDSGKRRLVVQGHHPGDRPAFYSGSSARPGARTFKRLENVLPLPVVSEALGPQEAKDPRISI